MTDSPSTEKKRRPIFFGWYMVAASIAANTVFSAAYFQGFGVLIIPIERTFGWDRWVISAAMSLRQLESGIVSPAVGFLLDRVSARKLIFWSAVIAGLGFIGLGIGLANPLGLVGALLHVLNHAVMKSCLFLVAGGILAQTGVKAIPRFSGLGRRMPLLMGGFAVAALSMVGVPPTAGFFSKWYLLLASLDANDWLLAGVIVASTLLTAVYFLKVFERVFTGDVADEAVATAGEPGGRVVAPVLVLAGAIVVIGLGNVAVVNALLDPVASQLVAAR